MDKIKAINKDTKEVVLLGEDYFTNHQAQFDLYVEPKKVVKRKKKVAVPKKVEKEVKADKE